MIEHTAGNCARRERLGILARADAGALMQIWQKLCIEPECQLIRGPETGLVTLRGRTGGGGAAFNFGEATVSRATVKLADGAIGHAVVLGRDHAKVKLAALIDALCHNPEMAERIEQAGIAPLGGQIIHDDNCRRAQAAATKVEFFTLVRGED